MTQWIITSTQDYEAWLEDYVRDIVSRELPPLPAHDFKVGNTEAHWHQVTPGVAYIATNGGTIADRVLVESLLETELAGHRYRRAFVEIDYDHDDLEKVAGWGDVQNDAKALVQSGAVRIIRNGYNQVTSQVKSQTHDGVTYDVEINRQDPSNQSITGSHCTCDWGQFQNTPRTRTWKRFQDRPCKHIIATQWQSMATPLDDAPGAQQQMPGMGGPTEAPGSMGLMKGLKPSLAPFRNAPAAPSGQLNPEQMGLFDQPAGGSAPQGMGPAPTPGPTPPSPESALPQFPMDPSLQPQHNPISMPGGKAQTPLNPVQYPQGPGGTFSSYRPVRMRSMAGAGNPAQFRNGDRVELLNEDIGTLEGRSAEHGAGGQCTVPKGQIGEVLGVHPTTGMVNVLYMGSPWDKNGPMEPYGATAWHFPSEVRLRNDVRAPGPAIRRPRGTF